MMKTIILGRSLFLILMSLFLMDACTMKGGEHPHPPLKKAKEKISVPEVRRELARLGYSIQAGAFSKAENAERLAETLQSGGLNATYFVAEKGLFKVQFGDFRSREEARERAEILHAVGVIDAYYIVSPGEYAVARREQYGDVYLREELIKTAGRFVGVPYLWGGASPEEGFDCSGLTEAVYRLNGLDLPRSSREQFEAGAPVEQNKLSKGDLVFFSTSGSGKISHVGIYTGGGQFIHAPRKGK